MSSSTVDALWKETPLLSSYSTLLGCSVHLKLEMLHPCKSFKYRGISLFIQRTLMDNPGARLVIASGGNAGYAAACVANTLGAKCDVYLPEGASEDTIRLLREQNANIIVRGRFYLEALAEAQKAVDLDTLATMVPAYDDSIVWEGHSSIVKELSAQLSEKPDAIFCSVGGGGLLGGIISGCSQVGWDDVPIVAVGTIGSDCFYHSIALNRGSTEHLPDGATAIHNAEHDVRLAHLTQLTSLAAGSLGASTPAPTVVKMALARKGGISCVSVADELSIRTCLRIADEHKLLVELACATALVPAYQPDLFSKLVPRGIHGDALQNVVFIACGGVKVSSRDLVEYAGILERDAGNDRTSWDVLCNGEKIHVGKQLQ